MKINISNIIIIVLLLLNGIGAVYGGLSLMIRPDGSGLGMSLRWLQNSPFHTYLIPGIVLFIFNGISSIWVFMSVIAKYKYAFLWVAFQGAVLVLWILIEMILMQTIHFLHITLGIIGLTLLISGSIKAK